jgi:Fe2+ transport system protein FeoA
MFFSSFVARECLQTAYKTLICRCDSVSISVPMVELTTLAQLPVGSGAVIRAMPTGNVGLTRLREMGLVPGARVEMVRRAPLGEPIEIRVRGSNIAMRNRDAAHISISPCAG